MTVTTDSLPDDPGTLKAMLIAERVRNVSAVLIPPFMDACDGRVC
jgi:hypothetical protein